MHTLVCRDIHCCTLLSLARTRALYVWPRVFTETARLFRISRRPPSGSPSDDRAGPCRGAALRLRDYARLNVAKIRYPASFEKVWAGRSFFFFK